MRRQARQSKASESARAICVMCSCGVKASSYREHLRLSCCVGSGGDGGGDAGGGGGL